MKLLRNADKKIPLFVQVLKKKPFNSIKHSGDLDTQVLKLIHQSTLGMAMLLLCS